MQLAYDTVNMVYGNDATSVQIVGSWFRKFKACNFNLGNQEHLLQNQI